MNTKFVALIAGLIAIITTSNSNAETGFFYASGYPSGPLRSYIALGGTDLLLPEDGWQFTLGNRAYEHLEAITFEIHRGSNDIWISLDMPDQGRLRPGLFEATRFPFNDNLGTAGFDWAFDSRGLNKLTAVFEILEVGYAEDNITVNKLALDFIQAEETNNAPIDLDTQRWAFGSYRLNSDIPVSVPEPSSVALLAFGGLIMARRRRG